MNKAIQPQAIPSPLALGFGRFIVISTITTGLLHGVYVVVLRTPSADPVGGAFNALMSPEIGAMDVLPFHVVEVTVAFVIYSALLGIVATPLVWWIASTAVVRGGATKRAAARIAAAPTMFSLWICFAAFNSLGRRDAFFDFFIATCAEIVVSPPALLSYLMIGPFVAHVVFHNADRV